MKQQLLDPALRAEESGFCDTGNEAGCTEWSGFLLDKIWISGNTSFVSLGSEIRKQECRQSLR